MCNLNLMIYGILIFFIVHCSTGLPRASMDSDYDNEQLQIKRQLAGTYKSRQHKPGVLEFNPGEYVHYNVRDLHTVDKKTPSPTSEIATTKIAITEIATTEIEVTEIATTEIAVTEIATTEIATTELATTEEEETKMGGSRSGSVQSFDDALREATANQATPDGSRPNGTPTPVATPVVEEKPIS